MSDHPEDDPLSQTPADKDSYELWSEANCFVMELTDHGHARNIGIQAYIAGVQIEHDSASAIIRRLLDHGTGGEWPQKSADEWDSAYAAAEDFINTRPLPKLNVAERKAMNSLPADFVDHLLAGERASFNPDGTFREWHGPPM